jgi:hypothetical protein
LVIPSHTQAIEAQVDNQSRALVQSFTSAKANGSSVLLHQSQSMAAGNCQNDP